MVRRRAQPLHVRGHHGRGRPRVRPGPGGRRRRVADRQRSPARPLPLDLQGPRCDLGHHGCAAAYLNREDLERRASAAAGRPVTFDDLLRARSAADATATRLLDDASRALGHLAATFAGALQTTCIVLAGEDVAALTGSPVMNAVIEDRLRPGPGEAQRCTLDIVTTELAFKDWAQGAAVVGIQAILGAS
ncbi:ROK family protein [Paractinoplanes durhamensis]|uniref:ROK family protein n=1 Tax=Paractinoplanes durhamensis TaxID=113563 RepID=UPI00362A431C